MKYKSSSYNRISLARMLRPLDFIKYKDLQDDDVKQKIIDDILVDVDKGFPLGVNIREIKQSSGKNRYTAYDIGTKLVFRKTQKNLASAGGYVKNRNQIIRELRQILADSSPYRVYKLDLSGFFESINNEYLNFVIDNLDTTAQTKEITKKIIADYNRNFNQGLPRGVEISPILSEMVLRDFDRSALSNENIFYYSRFVDDILIVTSSLECEKEFISGLRSKLPKGLMFNHIKKSVKNIKKHCESNKDECFDHLGYKITILKSNTSCSKAKKQFRKISVDISDKKTEKISGKIIKSFYSYSKNNDFDLLVDRLTFLSTNRNIIEKHSNKTVVTGIYYSHREASFESANIKKLDNLLKMLVLSPKGRVSGVLRTLTKHQKHRLLRISFRSGFRDRIFKRYNPSRLTEIIKIWKL